MPLVNRRAVLAGLGAAVAASSGCVGLGRSRRPAHEVAVYLWNRAESYKVTVSIVSESEEVLFEQEYYLSDSNEANEKGAFPASTTPETVRVSVDGTESVHPWPTFAEYPRLPCGENTRTGVEIWVGEKNRGTGTVEIQANCQSTTME